MSDKINFISKKVTRDKEGHDILNYIFIIPQEDITIIYINTPNNRAPNYMKQKLTRDIDSSTIMVGDFNTIVSIKDRTSRQKINNEIEDLKSQLFMGIFYRSPRKLVYLL